MRALVVRRSDSVDESALIEHCSQRLASFKRPRSVVFIDPVAPQRNGQGDEAGFAGRIRVSHPVVSLTPESFATGRRIIQCEATLMKIAVMGTGGVGGYFGGLLARAGNDVTFVARGPHLEAIRAHGLNVESANDGNFTARGNAVEDTSQAGTQELVLFTVKMYHNSDAIDAVKPMLGPDSLVLTLQNGIDNGQQLVEASAGSGC